MTARDDELLEGITQLVPALLTCMAAFEQVQRNMHPARLGELAEFIKPYEAALQDACAGFKQLSFPEHLNSFGDRLQQAATYSLRACNGISTSNGRGATNNSGAFAAMKAMRAQCHAQEWLYPVAAVFKPVSQYFLEESARNNEGLIEALNQPEDMSDLGLLTTNGDRAARGGFSLYVPENIDAEAPTPLVVALHGGTGHGADFIWSWLREARTRGFLLLSPTAQQDTWSLMGEDLDLPHLLQALALIGAKFNIDSQHILLTGMSDGGSYTLLAGLKEASPFTHLAPFSSVLHPDLAMSGRLAFAKDRDIYLVHGTQDWIFPIETAFMAQSALEAAGARLIFRPIEGLSHTYCRTENDALLRWFHPGLVVPD